MRLAATTRHVPARLLTRRKRFHADRQPSTVNRQPSTVNRQPSTVNRQPLDGHRICHETVTKLSPICKTSRLHCPHLERRNSGPRADSAESFFTSVRRLRERLNENISVDHCERGGFGSGRLRFG